MDSSSPADAKSPGDGLWRVSYATVTLFAVLGVAELLATFVLVPVAENRLLPPVDDLVATDVSLEMARRWHHPELGWVPPYATPWGERPRAVDRGAPRVLVFGDSFAHGDEVDSDVTWSEVLGRRLGIDVLNFGVPAYGFDQATLRFEEVASRFEPGETGGEERPVAILAFISPDLPRALTVFLPFLMPETDFPLTKPRFVLRGGEGGSGDLVLEANPIPSREGLERLRDPETLRRLGRRDGIYNRYGLPEPSWPRFRFFLRKSFWKAVVRRAADVDLWLFPEHRDLVRRVFARFVDGAGRSGFRPLIVHLPVDWEMLSLQRFGAPANAQVFVREVCAEEGWECVSAHDAVPTSSEAEIAALFTRGLEGGHYTEAGNRWVADVLEPHLGSLGSAAGP